MSEMTVEIEPSDVQMETEDLAPSEAGFALVARNLIALWAHASPDS
jgi:hypothetical protein